MIAAEQVEPSWHRDLKTLETLMPCDDGRRIILGLHIDAMKLPREVVQQRFALFEARSLDFDATFQDVLDAFIIDLLVSRFGVEPCARDVHDAAVAGTIAGLIKIAVVTGHDSMERMN
jgi:hypothetical protein